MGSTGRKIASLVCIVLVCLQAFSNGNPDKRIVRIQERRMFVADNLVEVALQYEGLQELTGNNDHPQIQAWLRETGLIGQYAWCAAAMAGIHNEAGLPNPNSARVVDWFRYNLVWQKGWGASPVVSKKGMVGAIYYRNLGRYGHIVMIVGEDNNNYYTVEGNTSPPTGNAKEAVVREAEKHGGFYRKVRSKEFIAALADYCVNGNAFMELYAKLLPK